MNILILGETGAGKSTWINAFFNFLTYSTLKEAMSGEVCALIPTEFTVCDNHLNEIKVSTSGKPGIHQVTKAGDSVTQRVKVYTFKLKSTTIQLIDTPGIGDTRGVFQDENNFKNILANIAHFDEIHGICILLKPNNARLTSAFQYCLKELLTYLHKDAGKNIVFCFTNTRGTFYRPGDTMSALKSIVHEKDINFHAELSRNLMYCFDSEAFRFLLARRNKPPVNFDTAELENYSESWKVSILEAKRMLKHIENVQPHIVQRTLNLNFARDILARICSPLAEVTRNIEINKDLINTAIETVRNTEDEMAKLNDLRFTKRYGLKLTALSHPKVVCHNTDCSKVCNFGGEQTKLYNKACHDNCNCILDKVQANVLGVPALLKCSAFQGKNLCKTCGHVYLEHLLIYSENSLVEESVEDENVINALKLDVDAQQIKSIMIANYEEEISSLDQRLLEIRNAGMKVASYIKRNGMVSFNNAKEEYLRHLIKQEEDQAAGNSQSQQKLKTLQDRLKYCIEEQGILEIGIAVEGECSSDDIELDKLQCFVQKYLLSNIDARSGVFDYVNNLKKSVVVDNHVIISAKDVLGERTGVLKYVDRFSNWFAGK